jgi:hypothetical protein
MRTIIRREPFEYCYILKLGPLRIRTPWRKDTIRHGT